MKQVNISIHPFSALVGMAVLSMAWVTAAAMPLQGSSSDRDVSAVEVVNEPHPRDWVSITNDAPFVVPSGHLLVVTAVGQPDNYGYTEVRVDGVKAVKVRTAADSGNQATMMQLPKPGLIVGEGQVVEFSDPNQERLAWGYLVDA